MKSLNMILGQFYYKWAMFFFDKEMLVLKKRRDVAQKQIDEIEKVRGK